MTAPDTNGTILMLEAEIERLENRLAASEVNRAAVNFSHDELAKAWAFRRKNAEAVNEWRDRYSRERLAKDQFESRFRDTEAQLAELTAAVLAFREADLAIDAKDSTLRIKDRLVLTTEKLDDLRALADRLRALGDVSHG